MPAFGSASAILWASVREASSWSLRSNSRRVVPAGSPHWADFSMIRSGNSAELRAFAVNPRPLRPEGLDAQDALASGGGVVAGEVKPKIAGQADCRRPAALLLCLQASAGR